MISVVMSTFNRSKRLKRAVESVIAQTYKDWELIVVDDCSTDDTKEVIHNLQMKHPKCKIVYVQRTQNFGTDTRPKNEGILRSIGDYIAFLDDDNEYWPDHLMVLSQAAKQQPKADVVYGDRLIVSDDNEFDPQVGIASDFNSALLVDRNFIDTSDVLIKREALFLVGGFDERYKKYVDWNLWVRMSKAGLRFFHIAKVITYYHIHKDMKSNRVFTKGDNIGKTPIGDKAVTPVFRPEWDFFELEIRLPYLGQQPLPRVAIFTLTMNRLAYTKRMYKSLLKSGYPFAWYVIDNGSTDGTVEWLKGLKPNRPMEMTKFIYNDENKGISIASNQALNDITSAENPYDFIIKIDNDCEILNDKWLDRLLEIMAAHWMIVLSPHVEGLVDNPGGLPRIAYKTLRHHFVGVVPHLGGIFVLAHKSAYDDFRWDETDFLHGMQDVIFSQHVSKKDYLLAYVEDMRCAHIDSTSGQKVKYPDYFERRVFEKTHIYGDTSSVQKRKR